uniref:Uncharacterized protein n=1 Tax=Romanomermis culicivorax TaxID=13658 RepID=A0A915JV98_ROMCU
MLRVIYTCLFSTERNETEYNRHKAMRHVGREICELAQQTFNNFLNEKFYTSTPAVGSSKTTNLLPPTKADAKQRRLFVPPDNVQARWSAYFSREVA